MPDYSLNKDRSQTGDTELSANLKDDVVNQEDVLNMLGTNNTPSAPSGYGKDGGNISNEDLLNKLLGAGSAAATGGLSQVAPNLALSGIQAIGGAIGLGTQGEMPGFSEPDRLEDMYSEFGDIAERGYPERQQAYQQRINRSLNTARQEAMDAAGPSTANAMTAAFTGKAIESQAKAAEMEADQRFKGLQQQLNVANQLRQDELKRQMAKRQQFNREQQAFGKATQSGLQNAVSSLNLATGINNAQSSSDALAGLFSGSESDGS